MFKYILTNLKWYLELYIIFRIIHICIFWQHFFIDTYLIEHNKSRGITNYGRFINQLPPNIIRSLILWYSKGITKKYLDKKCLLCSIKFVSMKKCCQNIHILNYIILQLINITSLWNTDGISWRDKEQHNKLNLHHFCNTSSHNDDPKLGRKYLGNN